MSCGDDLNWMIWEISDKGFKNKGIIPKTHSRTIYSCSWSKVPIMGEEGEQIELIATVRKRIKVSM